MLKKLNKGISTPIAIGIILLVAVVVSGIFAWQYWQYQIPGEELKLPPKEEGVEEQKLAEEAVKGYEDALKTRKRDEVLPYTTGEIKKEVQGWPPIFGTSNPHPGGSKILSSKKISDTEFEVKARHFEEYTGEGIIGYNDNTYTVEKIGDEYLVASIEYGEYVETAKEEPYIKVISPNGGEEWIIGDIVGGIYEIQWECSKQYSRKWSQLGIDIWLIGKHLKDGAIKIASISSKAGVNEYSWIIPSTITPAIDSFKIKIETPDGGFEDESDNYFSIVRASEGTTDWKTYRNKKYGFEVQYPVYSQAEQGSDEWIVDVPIVEIPINKKIITSPCYEAYIKKVDIGIESSDSTSSECLKEKVFAPVPKESSEKMSEDLSKRGWPESKEINNTAFYRRYFASHSMGGETQKYYAYQTFHDDKCYKISLSVRSGHSFGFVAHCPLSLSDSSKYKTLSEEEDSKLQDFLFLLLSTFRFLE